jgi:hypothetical protein
VTVPAGGSAPPGGDERGKSTLIVAPIKLSLSKTTRLSAKSHSISWGLAKRRYDATPSARNAVDHRREPPDSPSGAGRVRNPSIGLPAASPYPSPSARSRFATTTTT